MGDPEDGGTGRFVTASRLDADESVLDNVDPADSVLPGERIELQEDLDGIGVHGSSSGHGDLGRQAPLELDDNLLGLVGGVLGRSGQLPHVSGRGGVGVLENSCLVGNVEQVLVGRPGLRSGLEDRHAVLSSVLEECRSTGESVVEFCTSSVGSVSRVLLLMMPRLRCGLTREPPRCDDLDGGLQPVKGQLEPDLVVPLSGATVRDVAAERESQIWVSNTLVSLFERSPAVNSLARLPLGDLDHASGDDGPSERGSEEVDSLVDSVALDSGCENGIDSGSR